MAKSEHKITWWQLAAFAAPAAPLNAMTLPSVIFLPPHLATYVGVPLGVVSALFIGVRMLDIFIDPGIGNFQDRTHVPLGRRKFWILLGTPFIMAAIWMSYIFLWPGAPIAVVAAAIIFVFFTYAVMAIAHTAWAGELVPTYHGRTHVLGAVRAVPQQQRAVAPALPAVVRRQSGPAPPQPRRAPGLQAPGPSHPRR